MFYVLYRKFLELIYESHKLLLSDIIELYNQDGSGNQDDSGKVVKDLGV